MLAYKVKSAPAALCITVQRGRILYWVVYRLRYELLLSPCLRSRTARSSPCTWPRWPLRREPAACGGRSPCPADPCLFDVLTGGLSKHQLALGVDVDLGDTQADGLCDHLIGDAGAAVQNQRNVVGGLVDAVQSLEVQTLPVCGVDAVDVADAGSQEVNAQSGDLCALFGVSYPPAPTTPSSTPPMEPTSASMLRPFACARATSSLVFSTFTSME